MVETQSPITLFEELIAKAKKTEPFDATACVLATCGLNNMPSARWVLLKGVTMDGFQFFTNYTSKKSEQLKENPHAALAFHWHTLGVQIRIEGKTKKISDVESDVYFKIRPRESQIGAWASKQSRPLEYPKVLKDKVKSLTKQLDGQPIERPDFWGGYLLMPSLIEFWYNRDHRLHERNQFMKTESGWKSTNLYP